MEKDEIFELTGLIFPDLDCFKNDNKCEIPTKVSLLDNDMNYLTLHLDITGKLDVSIYLKDLNKLSETIKGKVDINTYNEDLKTKLNKIDYETDREVFKNELNTKISKNEFNLNNTAILTKLDLKADKSDLDNLATNTLLETKADKTSVYTKEQTDNKLKKLPDEEDITLSNNFLKFKDKEYIPQAYSGLGRVYLRKNKRPIIENGILTKKLLNVLTQDMINKPNTIYIIQYDYDLNNAGESEENPAITIPENCVLKFEGGSLSNGTLNGDNTVCANSINFKNCNLTGSWNINKILPEWFGAIGNGIIDDTTAVQKTIDFCIANQKILFLKNSYYITKTLKIIGDISIIGTNTQYRETFEENFIFNLIADSHIDTLIDVGFNSNKVTTFNIDNVSMKSLYSGGGKEPFNVCKYAILFTSINTGPIWPVRITNCHFTYFGHRIKEFYPNILAGAISINSTLNYCLAFMYLFNNSCYYCNSLITMTNKNYIHDVYIKNNFLQWSKDGIILSSRGNTVIENNNFDNVDNPIKIVGTNNRKTLHILGNYFEHQVSQNIEITASELYVKNNSFNNTHKTIFSINNSIIKSLQREKFVTYDIQDLKNTKCISEIPFALNELKDVNIFIKNIGYSNCVNIINKAVINNSNIIKENINIQNIELNLYIQMLDKSSLYITNLLYEEFKNQYLSIVFKPNENFETITLYTPSGNYSIYAPIGDFNKDVIYGILIKIGDRTMTESKYWFVPSGKCNVYSINLLNNIKNYIQPIISNNYDIKTTGTTVERPEGDEFIALNIGTKYFDTDLNKPIIKNKNNIWVKYDGSSVDAKTNGSLSNRPPIEDVAVGFIFTDTDNNVLYIKTYSEALQRYIWTQREFMPKQRFDSITEMKNVGHRGFTFNEFRDKIHYNTATNKFIFEHVPENPPALSIFDETCNIAYLYNDKETLNSIRKDTIFIKNDTKEPYIYNDFIKGLTHINGDLINITNIGVELPSIDKVPIGFKFTNTTDNTLNIKINDSSWLKIKGELHGNNI